MALFYIRNTVIQYIQFISIPFLKFKPGSTYNFPYIQNFILTNKPCIVIAHCLLMMKPCDAGNCVFKYQKLDKTSYKEPPLLIF